MNRITEATKYKEKGIQMPNVFDIIQRGKVSKGKDGKIIKEPYIGTELRPGIPKYYMSANGDKNVTIQAYDLPAGVFVKPVAKDFVASGSLEEELQPESKVIIFSLKSSDGVFSTSDNLPAAHMEYAKVAFERLALQLYNIKYEKSQETPPAGWMDRVKALIKKKLEDFFPPKQKENYTLPELFAFLKNSSKALSGITGASQQNIFRSLLLRSAIRGIVDPEGQLFGAEKGGAVFLDKNVLKMEKVVSTNKGTSFGIRSTLVDIMRAPEKVKELEPHEIERLSKIGKMEGFLKNPASKEEWYKVIVGHPFLVNALGDVISEDDLMNLVSISGAIIGQIRKPSSQMQFAALKQNPNLAVRVGWKDKFTDPDVRKYIEWLKSHSEKESPKTIVKESRKPFIRVRIG